MVSWSLPNMSQLYFTYIDVVQRFVHMWFDIHILVDTCPCLSDVKEEALFIRERKSRPHNWMWYRYILSHYLLIQRLRHIIKMIINQLKHFKGTLYSWKGVINLEETHRWALRRFDTFEVELLLVFIDHFIFCEGHRPN